MTGEPPPLARGERLYRWSPRAVASWDDLHMAEGRHRRRAIVLAVAAIVLGTSSVFVGEFFLALALVAAGLAAIEWAMWRRSRPRSRIPDYRPPGPVDVPLDEPPDPE